MQLSDFKARHNIVEHFVFISSEEFAPSTFIGPFGYLIGLGFWQDFDLIVVNQLMHTFRRQQGNMVNKESREFWAWGQESYATFTTNAKFDFQSRYLAFIGWLFL